MSQLAQIPENTLKIEVAKIPPVYVPTHGQIVCRSRHGMVYLFVDTRGVELTTVTAHDIGYTIAMTLPKLDQSEMVVIVINGERVELLPEIARKVSTALLRKADDADDWQLQH